MILGKNTGVITSRVSPLNSPIQQIKAAGVTTRGQTTQGLPLAVSNVAVAIVRSGSSRTLRVSFTHNSQDPYFVNAQLYLSQGAFTPTLLASGQSPIVVTVPRSDIPAVLTVVSNGNWGSTPLDQSPGAAVSLA